MSFEDLSALLRGRSVAAVTSGSDLNIAYIAYWDFLELEVSGEGDGEGDVDGGGDGDGGGGGGVGGGGHSCRNSKGAWPQRIGTWQNISD